MPRQLVLILALAVLLPFRPGPAAAAALDLQPDGASLGIETSCARHVIIRGDAALHGQIAVHAVADHPEEIDRLRAASGAVARLGAVPGGCWRPSTSFTPTLELLVRVPPGFALSIDDAGAPDYAIDRVGGTLALQLAGAVRLRDPEVATLAATLAGHDAVVLGRVRGAVQVELAGSGSLDIEEAAMPALAASVSGVGQVTVARGDIGSVALEDNGRGTIRIGATVGTGSAAIAGFGSIVLARVTGPLTRESSGLGTITVGD